MVADKANRRPSSGKALVLIGASTGGVEALCSVIQHFDAMCPPVVVAQHTGCSYGVSLARVMQQHTKAKVLHVVQSERPQALKNGTISLVAGGYQHSAIVNTGLPSIESRDGPPVSGHQPSIDVLFHSACGFGNQVVACLMTGMGRDGAEGLKSLRLAGSATFVQNEETSVVYGMPKAAWEIGAAQAQLPLGNIGPTLLAHARRIESASKHTGVATR